MYMFPKPIEYMHQSLSFLHYDQPSLHLAHTHRLDDAVQ
jgi:hypothetical protein